MSIKRLLRTMSDQIPSVDPLQPCLELNGQLEVDTVRSDTKALLFIIQNVLSYAVHVTRRRIKELSTRFRREVDYTEFSPIKVWSRYLPQDSSIPADSRSRRLQIVITFAQYDPLGNHANSSATASDISRAMQLEDICQAALSEYDVEVAPILEELGTSGKGNTHTTHSSNRQNRSTAGRKSCLSSVLLTAKQMLESCEGSLRLVEMPLDIAAATAASRRRGGRGAGEPTISGGGALIGSENMVIVVVPCVAMSRRDGAEKSSGRVSGDDVLSSSRRFVDESGYFVLPGHRSLPSTPSFQLGFLVTDNELCKYGIKLFQSCNVCCIRISFDILDTMEKNSFAAIVTDSLGTYSQLRMRGFAGKVVVMSTEAVYIDGKSSGGQILDYALSVPCDISDVLDLLQVLCKEKTHRPTVALNHFWAQFYRRVERALITYSHIPVVFGLWQVSAFLRESFSGIQLEVLRTVSWLSQERLYTSQEKELGHHLNMRKARWGLRLFPSDVEGEDAVSLRHVHCTLMTDTC